MYVETEVPILISWHEDSIIQNLKRWDEKENNRSFSHEHEYKDVKIN